MKKKDLIAHLSTKLNTSKQNAEHFLDAALETVYQSLKKGESVTLKDFGTFYINKHSHSTVFKFNPAQRMRKMLGWSSMYKGED